MHWLGLVVAGLIEIVFAFALQRSDGLAKPGWVLVFLAAGVVSLLLLSYAMAEIPLGTAYAVWTGIGAAGTAIMGMVLLEEPAGAARLLCIALIVVAVVGLNFANSGQQ